MAGPPDRPGGADSPDRLLRPLVPVDPSGGRSRAPARRRPAGAATAD